MRKTFRILIIMSLLLSFKLNAQNLSIWMINVGQGDAIFLKSDTTTVLIDAGGTNAARDTILNLLSNLGVHRINYFFGSHYDSDHIGKLEQIIPQVPVQLVYDRGIVDTPTTATYSRYASAISRIRNTIQFNQTFQVGNTQIKCIAVNGRWSSTGEYSKIHNEDEENNRSIGLLIEAGKFRFLTLGDLESPVEDSVGPRIGNIDLLKISHHGSKLSSSDFFLNQLTPEAALLSVGDKNSYSHPTVETMGRLTNCNSIQTIYQTTIGKGGTSVKSKIFGTTRIDIYNSYYTIAGDTFWIDTPNQKPIATIESPSKDTSVYVNDIIQFIGNGQDPDGVVTSYLWNFGDGSTSSAVNPIHQFISMGQYNVQFTVMDSENATSDPVSIKITVDQRIDPLAIISESIKSGTVGIYFIDTLKATGGVPPYKWKMETGVLPSGFSLDSITGIISGTTASHGNFSFTIKLSDSQAPSASISKGYLFTIKPALLTITKNQLLHGKIAELYSDTLTGFGGVLPYVWSIITGNLPIGIILDSSTGIISGVPQTYGSFNISFQLKDSQNPPIQTEKAYQLIIDPVILTITTDSLIPGNVNDAYNDTLKASGGILPYKWKIINGILPIGLQIDSTSGIISGIIQAQGSSCFIVQVEDSQSPPCTDTGSFSIICLTDIAEPGRITKNTELFQNYPNPFNPSTTISYWLKEPGFVEIEIFNISGEKVKTIISQFQTTGFHSVLWDGYNDKMCLTSSGMLFYQLKTNKINIIKKMILIE